MTRVHIVLVVVGGVLIFAGVEAKRLAGATNEKPQAISCQQLADNGPGDNAHVTLSHFVLWTPAYVYEAEEARGDWNRVWIPALPQGGEAHQNAIATLEEKGLDADVPLPRNIRVVAVLKSAKTEADIEREANQATLTGVVVNKIDSLGSQEKKLLEESYPGVDFDHVWILEVGREPPTASSAWGLILGGLLLAIGAVGHLVIKAGRDKPPEEPEFAYQDQIREYERVGSGRP